MERSGQHLDNPISRLLHKGEPLCCSRDSASVTYGDCRLLQQSQQILFRKSPQLSESHAKRTTKREAVTKSVTTSLYIQMLVPLHLKLHLEKNLAMTMLGIAIVAVAYLMLMIATRFHSFVANGCTVSPLKSMTILSGLTP